MNLSSEEDSDDALIDRIRVPKDRNFKERVKFLAVLDDQEFLRRFRVSKQTFNSLCDEIREISFPV